MPSRKARTTACALMLAFATLGAALPAQAKSDPESNVAPPPARTETIPKHKAGYVWAPGYWSWSERGHKHVWIPGRLLKEKRGARWVPDQWVEKDGRYRFSEGRWEAKTAAGPQR
jgi:hypothetical protein